MILICTVEAASCDHFGQDENIYRMITIIDYFSLVGINKWDHRNVITLSD